MEPVTHFLTGACLGRSGFNRHTAYATLAMTLAAEAPDIDILWGFRGPVAAFEHHRGITHTFLGAPFVALAVTALCWVIHRFSRKRSAASRRLPVRWGIIWLLALIAVLSHIFLDWTNNYGVRPFFPFHPRWYSLDIVFIFEPVLFGFLLLGLVIPAILGLADREIRSERAESKPVFRGRGWAIAALTLSGVLWGVRAVEHHRAIQIVRSGGLAHASTLLPGNQPVLRAAAEPYPINPFHWFAIAETPDAFETAALGTRTSAGVDAVDADSEALVFKPPVTLATLTAKRCWLGRVYLDWSRFPVVTDRGHSTFTAAEELAPNPLDTTVQFRDLRYAYSPFGGRQVSASTTPLSAWVYVSPSRTIDAMVMDQRVQK